MHEPNGKTHVVGFYMLDQKLYYSKMEAYTKLLNEQLISPSETGGRVLMEPVSGLPIVEDKTGQRYIYNYYTDKYLRFDGKLKTDFSNLDKGGAVKIDIAKVHEAFHEKELDITKEQEVSPEKKEAESHENTSTLKTGVGNLRYPEPFNDTKLFTKKDLKDYMEPWANDEIAIKAGKQVTLVKVFDFLTTRNGSFQNTIGDTISTVTSDCFFDSKSFSDSIRDAFNGSDNVRFLLDKIAEWKGPDIAGEYIADFLGSTGDFFESVAGFFGFDPDLSKEGIAQWIRDNEVVKVFRNFLTEADKMLANSPKLIKEFLNVKENHFTDLWYEKILKGGKEFLDSKFELFKRMGESTFKFLLSTVSYLYVNSLKLASNCIYTIIFNKWWNNLDPNASAYEHIAYKIARDTVGHLKFRLLKGVRGFDFNKIKANANGLSDYISDFFNGIESSAKVEMARQGDPNNMDGEILTGAEDVLIEGKKAARCMEDHQSMPIAGDRGPTIEGNPTIKIGDKDSMAVGKGMIAMGVKCSIPAKIIEASENVLMGEDKKTLKPGKTPSIPIIPIIPKNEKEKEEKESEKVNAGLRKGKGDSLAKEPLPPITKLPPHLIDDDELKKKDNESHEIQNNKEKEPGDTIPPDTQKESMESVDTITLYAQREHSESIKKDRFFERPIFSLPVF